MAGMDLARRDGRTAGMFTDLQELRMADSYLRRGMTGKATFSLFVRDLPERRGFLVAAGLAEALEFLEDFGFQDDDLAWLRRDTDLASQTLAVLRDLRFSGDVYAVPEGRLVFADEPLLEVTAPLPQAQLVETGLLNALTHATAVATKAARCRLAAGDRDVVDFSARRTHGREAARTAARASAIVGFTGTGNAEAARDLGLRGVGTMTHSYIEAHGTDRTAFQAFAEDFPSAPVFLVGTYNTLAGVRAAIDVIGELGLGERAGIRLDSGDMVGLSYAARRLLDAAGLRQVRIMASGGLDEDGIAHLLASRAPIDSFGVGTRTGTSADMPYLDTVYELVAYADRPIMKSAVGEAALPGDKQVFRGPAGDVLSLREEQAGEGCESLLVPVMVGGVRTGVGADAVNPITSRRRFKDDLAWLPEAARRLDGPVPVVADRSRALEGLRHRLAAATVADQA